ESESSRTWLAVTGVSFDISILELFWTLSRGYRVILHDGDATKWLSTDSNSIAATIVRHNVSHLQCTPSLASMLLETPQACAALRILRKMMVGGEALPPDLARRLKQHLGGDLLNLYGPTETTVWSTVQKVEGLEDRVAIGKPISNSSVYILDDDLNPVPPGIYGEIFIGGSGVSRGYLRLPALTAERFVPDPFASTSGHRLYRTGDVGQYREDGTVDFLGRRDHQIKINGHRVELTEIETILRQHPDVHEAVVVADLEAQPALVAYVVPGSLSIGTESVNPDALARVGEWAALWNEIYAGPVEDATFNLQGWTSRLTGVPFSAEEMREWLDSTAQRILALKPRRVLEVGGGSGLLMYRIAPVCERYVITDSSPRAIDRLRESTASMQMSNVEARVLPAHEVDRIGQDFDLVVLNSVIQYFPCDGYLMETLRKASHAVLPGGVIFLGDILNFDLLEVLHACFELDRCDGSVSRESFLTRVRVSIRGERELFVSPDYLKSIAQRLGRSAYVQTQLRGGRCLNELTRFRYDAIFYLDHADTLSVSEDMAWNNTLSVEGIIACLDENDIDEIRVRRVPNPRLSRERQVSINLNNRYASCVAEIRPPDILSTEWSPADVWALASQKGCAALVDWSTGDPFFFDVTFRRQTPAGRGHSLHAGNTSPGHSASPIGTNDPLQGNRSKGLDRSLDEYLRDRLPAHMVPVCILIDRLPLNPNQKVDRRTLKALYGSGANARDSVSEVRTPLTPTERVLEEIWRETLNCRTIEVAGNFFALGGHSLSAIRILSRIADQFGIRISLAQLVENPTIAGLAKLIDVHETGVIEAEPISEVPRDEYLLPSLNQEARLVFELNAELESRPYLQGVIPVGLRLEGKLDYRALQQAFDMLSGRHEVLRATFHPSATFSGLRTNGWDAIRQLFGNGTLRPTLSFSQKFTPDSEILGVDLIDVEEVPDSEQQFRIQEIGINTFEKKFDYESAPLFRSTLVRLNSTSHILYIALSHLLGDGWSAQIFQGELAFYYSALVSGTDRSLPELPIQFMDFAYWQREQVNKKDDRFVRYGETFRQLDPINVNSLPFAREPWTTTRRSDREILKIEPAVCEGIQQLCRQTKLTPFMVFLAAFETYLCLLTEREDIGVWTFVANRSHPKTAGLIGWFAHEHLLALRFSSDPTLGEVLTDARSAVANANAFEAMHPHFLSRYLAPSKLVPRVRIEMLPARNPDSNSFAGLTAKKYPTARRHMQTDVGLRLLISDDSGRFAMICNYDTDRFGKAAIQGMLTAIDSILRKMVVDRGARVSSLQLHA
ncbi:MAG TPA: condensation domain-containing protein, partial [Terriglobia bacterium]|nr:condensation domain-containing protein [Terriglobia bacterium]